MTLATRDAESILRARLGEPAKPPTDYVIGFTVPSGKVLAIHRTAAETRIWFQPPAPPMLDGVQLMDGPSNGNSNINGPLSPLLAPTTLRVEVDGPAALNRFLDWYAGERNAATAMHAFASIDSHAFGEAFARFQELITAKSGHAFAGFDEGLAAVWESYKPRLRDHALQLLRAEDWTESEIGSGVILSRTIKAIEIQDSWSNLTNNLVFWQNRFGHANRDHRALIDAQSDPILCPKVEQLIYQLYRSETDDAHIFRKLTEISGGKYPLLAYLFFLKDMDRFMPIQPTGFDRAFAELGTDFRTLRHCEWANYSAFNAVLNSIRPLIADAAGLPTVRLIDAHSFCWIFATLLKQGPELKGERKSNGMDPGRVLGGRETAIKDMRYSIEQTVKQSKGQTVQTTVKDKKLLLKPEDLEALLSELVERQEGKCALTGIPFCYGPSEDKQRRPSADRIDSKGHYEPGNIQIVCRFVNFWKGATPNEEFERLLRLVQGIDAD